LKDINNNILLIGAGHIGAISDLHSDKVNTYAKYFNALSNVNVSVIEPNEDNASLVLGRYGFKVLPNYDTLQLSNFFLVVIASPSQMHYQQLLDCVTAGVSNIICEKPICVNMAKLQSLQKTVAEHNKSNIFVNYPRTFIPEFSHLKKLINIRHDSQLIKIRISYQRGFLNNCSHAFNLISFLFDRKIEIHSFTKTQSITDDFEIDPTISGFGYWDETFFEVSGVPYAKYSLFEVDIFFDNYRVLIDECGRRINLYQADTEMKYIQPIPNRVYSDLIADYSDVEPVLKSFFDGVDKPKRTSNFERALSENYALLKILES
jgi:predicted dehydrogenase